jgi:Xaa-Pro aminopeptidase
MTLLEKAKSYLQKVDAIFFNTQDEFLSEYTKPANNDVFQITGFSGSNGFALLTKTKSILFTDGRYTIQAKNELPTLFEVRDISSFFETLKQEGVNSMVLNFNRVSIQFAQKLQSLLPQFKLVHLRETFAKQFVSNNNFYEVETGIKKEEKLNAIAQYLREKNKDGFFVGDAQNTCWVLNIRGSDEDFTPVYKATLFVRSNGSYIINPELHTITGGILIDSQTTLMQYNSIFAEKEFDDFITNQKAVKNNAEILGVVNAHKIDGKILTEFFNWLEENYEGKTEWEISQKLLEFRKTHKAFKMLSFATICGCGENGAIIHYNPQKEVAKVVVENSTLLMDSGAQLYGKDILGTTDITRTVFLGEAPPEEYKTAFTLVLKGHIAVATAVFSQDTPSSYFDELARKFLKEHNMDYPHSTGHGVGAFLSVHEAGCGISSRNPKPLKEGMLLSNEPGYYLEGKFGIRIESLILVRKNTDGNLFFETITLVPIQEKSVDFTLLTQQEKQWLKSYNKKCMENLVNNLW